MSNYIDREKAREIVCDFCRWAGTSNCEECEHPVDDVSAADVRPVVRGEWKDAMKGCHDSPHVKCSVCGEYYWQYFKKFNFCPNCGADMSPERGTKG